jgi:hypothetical protein
METAETNRQPYPANAKGEINDIVVGLPTVKKM